MFTPMSSTAHTLMCMKKHSESIPILILTGLLSYLHAQPVNLQKYAAYYNADTTVIAVLPFAPASGSARQSADVPRDIVQSDLSMAGRLKVVPCDRLDSTSIARQRIRLCVSGTYRITHDSVHIDWRVVDAVTAKQLAQNTCSDTGRSLRSPSHRMTNQLYAMVYQEKGIFESRIAFVRKNNGRSRIVLADYDAGSQRVIVDGDSAPEYPRFIDSTALLFVSAKKGNRRIHRYSLASGATTLIVGNRSIHGTPAVCRQTGKIAYACATDSGVDLFSCDSDGANEKRLTATACSNTSPCWSPMGSHIAYVSDCERKAPQLFVLDINGAFSRRLTYRGAQDGSTAWSPRGNRTAYAFADSGRTNIWHVDPFCSSDRPVTATSGNSTHPVYSRDGSFMMFASSSGNKSDLCIIRSDGTGLRRLTTSGDCYMPDWLDW
jgi:TolB protein